MSAVFAMALAPFMVAAVLSFLTLIAIAKVRRLMPWANAGTCPSDANGNGICDNEEANGCTYQIAVNYNPVAVNDDGSCLFQDVPSACGFVYDGNADGNVGTQDLLGLLAEYGLDCNE